MLAATGQTTPRWTAPFPSRFPWERERGYIRDCRLLADQAQPTAGPVADQISELGREAHGRQWRGIQLALL
jgi:hypothetical protein